MVLNSKQDVLLVAKGLATYVPLMSRLIPSRGTGGTDGAEYCYGVWLKHLTLLHAHCGVSVPRSVAEIGPGDSIGVGLAALLSGANEYRALDVVRYATVERSLKVFDELVSLFRMRAARPTKGWPDFDQFLDGDLFPGNLLTQAHLDRTLAEDRVRAIRAALMNPGVPADGILVSYAVPWTDASVIEDASIDLIFSHSVLEHVVDLDSTYRCMYRWLRPGAWMSHQIDFSSHGIGRQWNGHRAYGEMLWKVIVGRRPWLLNREPPSSHLKILENQRFEMGTQLRQTQYGGLVSEELAPRWRQLPTEELQTLSLYLQARRPAHGQV
jgi:hypothetical protein